MPGLYLLFTSRRSGKKFSIVNPESASEVHFGDASYEDYTQHKDEERKESYLKRHRPNQNWDDPTTAGFWARWLLWNKPTLNQSIQDTEERFNIHIILEKSSLRDM